jgi:hypothetical protein
MTKQEIRRAVIREWMALPSNQRQTKEQTDSFALKAMHRHELPRSRNDAYQVMMGWLLSRTGKP